MIDVERALLGACALSGKAYWSVADRISPDDFGDASHRALWEAIAETARATPDYDALTIGERFPAVAHLAVSVASEVPGIAAVKAYAERVAERAHQRRFLRARDRVAKADSLQDAYGILAACRPRDAGAVRPAREFLRASLRSLQERLERDRATVGLPSGISTLDEMTTGWQPGDLIILGARPSTGKTALALQFALESAVNQGVPALFFSVEMSGEQLVDRAVSHLGRVPFGGIRNPANLEDYHWPAITAAGEKIQAAPLLIDESGGLTLDALCARARQVHAEHALGLILVDYLQHMVPPKAQTLAESTEIMTRTIKALAKELRVPVILLSQLNREGVGRPGMKDLRNSGAIEQDADVILLMYRADDKDRTMTTLIVEKQRNGPTGDLFLASNLSLMRFDASHYEPPAPQERKSFGRRASA